MESSGGAGEKCASGGLPALRDTVYSNAALEARYEQLLAVRADVSKALELARNDKMIGQSLEARVLIEAPAGEWRQLLEDYRDELATLFIVSQAKLTDGLVNFVTGEEVAGLKVRVEPAAGKKCDRCWTYAETVGENAAHPCICRRCVESLV